MKKTDIIRAWKDQDLRNSINDAEISGLPAHPAVAFNLSDDDLRSVSGALGRTFPEGVKISNTDCCYLK